MAADDTLISVVIAKLEANDREMADDARAALDWITGDEDLELLTQERLQHFVWYGLPMKWLTDTDHRRRVVEALAQLLDLLDLRRYAAICRSDMTAKILDAYERSDAEGKKAMRTAVAASGIHPPHLDDFAWGDVMGWEESQALSSTADILELAVAGGEILPGSRGWKARQQDLVRAHLTTARIELKGRTFLDAIRGERLETWLESPRSPSRRQLLEPLINVVRSPVDLPAGIDDPVPPLRWLLGQLVEGQPLTQTGNLGRAFVQDAATRFGWWDFRTPPRTEDELYDLHQVRHLAQRLGFVRRTGRKLTLTTKGKAALTDTDRLQRTVARGLLPDHEFAETLGEVTLAVLASNGPVPQDELDRVLIGVVTEVGWRSASTGQPPDERDINWGWHQTTNLLHALTLLSVGGGWDDRSYGLTDAGRAIALEALHQRATGPRSRPW